MFVNHTKSISELERYNPVAREPNKPTFSILSEKGNKTLRKVSKCFCFKP